MNYLLLRNLKALILEHILLQKKLKKNINQIQKNKMTIEIRKGARIMNEYGKLEIIYGIENEGIRKYFSTISIDDLRFPILKTYFIEKIGDEIIIEEVIKKEKNVLNNLEKANLESIENEMGLTALAVQLS